MSAEIKVSRLPRFLLRFVGISAIVLAGLGIWYNLAVPLGLTAPTGGDTPYFWQAFWIMSGVCCVCFLVLAVIGIQFICIRTSALRALIRLLIFEFIYFITVSMFWLAGDIGMSVAAATGVANGGLIFQVLTGFIVWGPLVARSAKTSLETVERDRKGEVFPAEQIEKPSDWIWAAVNFVVVFALGSVLVAMFFQRIGMNVPPELAMLVGPGLLGVASAGASVRNRRRRRTQKIERRRSMRMDAGLCPRCQYNLTGLAEPRCPECGLDLPPEILTKFAICPDRPPESE